ncbi:hypothetical protein WCX49_06720 [Sulfurimonas sp. HSL-1656]|uniref:hypothetical protein n=1 Tax=Thiomicrolovo subterrani TaxID=3131934 RepID=UPI0031F84DB2
MLELLDFIKDYVDVIMLLVIYPLVNGVRYLKSINDKIVIISSDHTNFKRTVREHDRRITKLEVKVGP